MKYSNTILKYINYLKAIIYDHHILPPYRNVNIKDNKLLEKYGLHSTSAYRYMVNRCIEMNFIFQEDKIFHAKVKPYFYSFTSQFLFDNGILNKEIINYNEKINFCF